LFWLSDEQWKRIEPFLPTDVRGVERVDDRRVISGIVQVLKSGCRWCDCPAAYGLPTTIYNRFVRWARRGIWENLFRKLAGTGSSANTQMIDSTHVKAHRSAALRPLFRDDMAAQTKMFMYILSSAVRGLNRMQEMVGGLRALGKRHADYGVKRDDYDEVSSAFIRTLKEFLAGEFTAELQHAWVTILGMIAETMIEAAEN
jgi:transposase